MSEPTPKAPRGPTNLRIKFRSASLDQFIERYAVDVSRGGIFIRTREPLPVDTRLRLEFQLQDSTPLLAGEGTVVWIREPDPARENVTPGMGVRFDKLTPESQPTLEKILAEKTRLEQAGVAAVGQAKGGGMAVRRPSGVFASLDANARAVLGAGLPGGSTEAPATGPESTPISAPPPPPSAVPAVSKTSFLASRTGAPTAPASAAPSGPFTRARNTSGRPVPVPSALFEAPTAADIDKALEVLQEAPGPAPAPHPLPSAPRYVADDASNEPTRVGDVVEELVGGGPGPRGTVPGSGAVAGALDGVGESSANTASSETRLDGPVEIADVDVEPAVPEAQAAVAAPVAPEPSKRFRAASRAYPTLNKRRSGVTTALVALVVLGAAAGVAVKLHLKDRLFPTAPAPTAPARTAAAPATAEPVGAPAPAATAPATAPAAPEGAGGAGAVAAAPPQQAAPEAKVNAEKAAPDKPAPENTAAGKPPADDKKPAVAAVAPDKNEEHAAKHKPSRHKAEAAAAAPAAASATAEKPAAEKPAAEQPVADKPAAEQPAPEKAAEGASTDKPAADKPAAAAPAPAAPILKVTSSPSGAQVLIDGRELGNTPFVSKEVDASAPHTITIKKDGYEPNERMVSGLDWSRPHGNTPQTLKVNAKLRRTAAAPAATTGAAPEKENAEPQDTGGPYIKEIKPDSP
jgi:uncharacterized protein (TIGR02266 family)